MIIVRPREDPRQLGRLAPHWNALLEKSADPSIFLTWEWVSTWLELYGEEIDPLVLVAEEQGTPCGIAPLMIRRGARPVGHLSRTLTMIGEDRDLTPEYLDFIIPRGREAAVTAALVRELTGGAQDRWDFVAFRAYLQGSPNRAALTSALDEAGVELRVEAEDVAPYAELPGSFHAFLQGKSPGFRKQHKNKLNRLQRAGQVRYLLGGRDLPVDVALEHIIRLNSDRWQDSAAAFVSERSRLFHRRLCRRLAPHGWVVLMLMELDGEVVAGRYDFAYAGKLWCYQGGWSPRHRELNLGDNMLAEVIRWGIEQGFREYDFLGGRAVYKDRWATATRSLLDLRAVNTTGRAQLLRWLRGGRELWRRARERRPPVATRRSGSSQHASRSKEL